MNRRRLARHHLLDRADDIVAAVRDIGGVQAQVMSAAEWAIGARVEGVTVDDVRAELWERRRLLKGYTLRGTLHLVPSDEAAMWTAAIPQGDEDDTLVAAIGSALRGRCLTRAELADAVGDERLLSQWGDHIAPAFRRGILCFGPPRGAQVTFVHRQDWGVPWKRVARARAQAEAARRYLAAYGPATSKEFARWTHIDRAEAKAAFDALDLDPLGHGFVLAGDGEEPPPGPPVTRLVPQYDAYILGAFPREQIVPPEAKARIAGYKRGRWEGAAAVPLVLVDGVVAGLWDRKGTVVTVEPFTDLDRAALEAEVERLAAFSRKQASLRVGRLA